MILITDGGSTKCDWILLDGNGKVLLKTRSKGLNPAVVPQQQLYARIQSNKELQPHFEKVSSVDFYGAGCGTEAPVRILSEVLKTIFPDAVISINEDLTAAVYAATTEPGIVCILGTGSNSCYYDGEEIHTSLPSLGYTLMDEASGSYFGKQLIRDYFYKKMPMELASKFEKHFDLDVDEIKLNLYKRPNPNTYLASFAEFIFNTEEVNGYFHRLITEGITKFIENHVLSFKEAQEVPIHFIGSIAHLSKNVIRERMDQYRLELGNIIQRPIDGLIEYYKEHKLK